MDYDFVLSVLQTILLSFCLEFTSDSVKWIDLCTVVKQQTNKIVKENQFWQHLLWFLNPTFLLFSIKNCSIFFYANV